jgi:hypothetical protein
LGIKQYDVVRNGDASKTSMTPYLLVLQHDITEELPSVIVAPISRIPAKGVIGKLNIPVTVGGVKLHIIMQEMGVTHRSRLRSVVEHRSDLHDEVIKAVDLLFSGI